MRCNKFRTPLSALATILLLALLIIGCSRTEHAAGEISPPKPVIYTACGQITDVAVGENGGIWAATKGGLLHWEDSGKPPKLLTTADGLPVNELRSVAVYGSAAYASGPTTLIRTDASGGAVDLSSRFKGEEIKKVATAGNRLFVGTSKGLYEMVGGSDPVLKQQGDVEWLDPYEDKTLAVIDNKLLPSDRKEPIPLPQETGHITGLVASGGEIYLSGVFGIWRLTGGRWSEVALPNSSGTHVSAVASKGDKGVYASVYGDGLYIINKGRWTRLNDTPQSFKHITTIAIGFKGPIVGTQDDGVWVNLGRGWTRLEMPPYLPSADIYGITTFDDSVWVATFDRGLMRLTDGKWTCYTRSHGLSTDSPRELVVFHNKLYVRHTTGQVDLFDGTKFTKAFDKSQVPREVYSIYTEGRRLYMGTWGGWVATDGKSWEQHFREPGLQKHVATTIAADGNTVWIGTQKGGLFRWKEGKLTHFHETNGLTDDWITCIAIKDGRLLIGTYVGGLLEQDGERFRQIMTSEGFWTHAAAFLNDGRAAAATTLGVYVENEGIWELVSPSKYGGLESQALCPTSKGLWVGGRTALAYMPME